MSGPELLHEWQSSYRPPIKQCDAHRLDVVNDEWKGTMLYNVLLNIDPTRDLNQRDTIWRQQKYRTFGYVPDLLAAIASCSSVECNLLNVSDEFAVSPFVDHPGSAVG